MKGNYSNKLIVYILMLLYNLKYFMIIIDMLLSNI